MESRSLPELARWLDRRFPKPPEEYEAGREQLAAALAEHLGCPPDEAASVLEELERAGYLRYAAEARSIGGSAGTWIVYQSPVDNPESSPA